MFITLTPHKFESMKTIRFERTDKVDQSLVHYVAIKQHKGIIVCKEQIGNLPPIGPPEIQLEYNCVMINNKTLETHGEKRRLKFWFLTGVGQSVRLGDSYSFAGKLFEMQDFQKDYVGFFKKVAKQMNGNDYPRMRRIDLDIIPLAENEKVALFPEDLRKKEQVVREALLMRLEEAYPNFLSTDDLIRILNVVDTRPVGVQLQELTKEELIEVIPLEGQTGYRRKVVLQNQDVREMKSANQMQQVFSSEKPTIAIITNLLCEKLAVDAMIEQKTTFVRYKTEGESNVYTVGNIGSRRVICTKLPMVGHELQAKISSGSATTRLLGASQSIQHVFLVGVGGSVPHVYEFEKHSRLGDIVVSAPTMRSGAQNTAARVPAREPMYIYCEKIIAPEGADDDESGTLPVKFALKQYSAKQPLLLGLVNKLLSRFEANPDRCEWARILDDAMKMIGDDETVTFTRPPADTDKLLLKINKGVTFGIRHPDVPEKLARLYPPGVPAVRLGCVGSGRPITENDKLRDPFANENHLLCYDAEYDQVLESVTGNNVESFLIIRGIADYVDGRQGTQWQPYAALAAASLMKAIILELPKVATSYK